VKIWLRIDDRSGDRQAAPNVSQNRHDLLVRDIAAGNVEPEHRAEASVHRESTCP
jgi:hypothetical protein